MELVETLLGESVDAANNVSATDDPSPVQKKLCPTYFPHLAQIERECRPGYR